MLNFGFARKNIARMNSYLLAAVFCTIPIQVCPAYILTAVIFLLWLIEGDLYAKWSSLRRHRLVWVFWIYFMIPYVSLLWSRDLAWGLQMADKSFFFFIFPLYLSVARKEHVKLYITSFIAALALTELMGYYNWFHLNCFPNLPEGILKKKSSVANGNIAPFIDYIMYNPIVAFGTYLLGHSLLFEKPSLRKFVLYSGILAATIIFILISGGRSGQVGFLAMVALLILQRFARRPLIAVVAATGLTAVLIITAYQTSDLFRQRADRAAYEVMNYRQAVNTAVGLRINFSINTIRMFAESPILGVGVGDYPAEYARINAQYSPQWDKTRNPHNQYLFALSTTGLAGGAILLCILFWPPYISRTIRDEWSKVRIALPVLFAVICFGESYLWRSNTGLMFVVFSAILYPFNCQNNNNTTRNVLN